MVTPWWFPTILGVLLTVSFGFWGWIAVKVVEQERKIASIEAMIRLREIECSGRMDWLRKMDEKISMVREDVANIRGALENAGIERRRNKEGGGL